MKDSTRSIGRNPLRRLAVAALGILGSQFGFASLVAVLYPLFGYAALPFTGAILWKVCRGR